MIANRLTKNCRQEQERKLKALAQRDSGQADVQSAQANEQQAEINLGYTNVTAPFDGVVTARQVSMGELVGAGSPPTTLATIVQLDPIWVNFNVSEKDVLDIRAEIARKGLTVEDLKKVPVEVELQTETGFPHKGTLDYSAPTLNQATGTLPARPTPVGRCGRRTTTSDRSRTPTTPPARPRTA